MDEKKVKVSIFGNVYSIQGDAPPEYILQLAEFVHTKMDEVGRNISNANQVKIAILAALNIADEYFQLKEMKLGMNGIIERKTKALISMLDEGLIGDVYGAVGANRRELSR